MRAIVDWVLLALLVAPSVLGVVLYGAVSLWVAGPLIVVTCVAGVGLCLQVVFRRGPAAVLVPPGLLGLIALSAYAFGVAHRSAVPFEATLEGARLASYAVAYAGFCVLGRRGSRWRILLGLLLVLGCSVAGYAIVQELTGSNRVLLQERPEQYGMRASGTFVCPNHLANMLQVLLVFGVTVLVMRRSGWLLRLGALAFLALGLPVLLLSQSRAGWLGTAASAIVLAVLSSLRAGWRRALAAAVVGPTVVALVAVSLWFGSPTFRSRVEDALRGDIRLAVWRDTAQGILDQPVWGHGPGSFRWLYPRYKVALRRPPAIPHRAHNEYLQMAFEYGGVATAGLILVMAAGAVRLLMRVPAAASHRDRMLAAALLAALAGTAVHAAFDFNLRIFAIVHLLALLSGLVMARLFAHGELKALRVGRGAVRCLAAAAAAALLLIAGWSGRATVSHVLADASDLALEQGRGADVAERLAAYGMRAQRSYWRPYEAYAAALEARAYATPDQAGRAESGRASVAAYGMVLDLNPYRDSARVSLSRIHRDVLNEPERGIQILRDLVKECPRISIYWAELGEHLRRAGQLEEAFKAFRLAKRHHRTNPAYWEETRRSWRAMRREARQE